jgi:hypothetical protein
LHYEDANEDEVLMHQTINRQEELQLLNDDHQYEGAELGRITFNYIHSFRMTQPGAELAVIADAGVELNGEVESLVPPPVAMISFTSPEINSSWDSITSEAASRAYLGCVCNAVGPGLVTGHLFLNVVFP